MKLECKFIKELSEYKFSVVMALPGAKGENGLDAKGMYDVVITTQDEFEELLADTTWAGATSVAITGGIVLTKDDGYPIAVPANVKQIHGFGRPKLYLTICGKTDINPNGYGIYKTDGSDLEFKGIDCDLTSEVASGTGGTSDESGMSTFFAFTGVIEDVDVEFKNNKGIPRIFSTTTCINKVKATYNLSDYRTISEGGNVSFDFMHYVDTCQNSTFILNNTLTTQPGYMVSYTEKSARIVRDCTFEANITNSYFSFLINPTLVDGCAFTQYGGKSVEGNSTNTKVTNCVFSGVSATEVVFLGAYNVMFVSNCTFNYCTVGCQGVKYISMCRFTNCSTNYNGATYADTNTIAKT